MAISDWSESMIVMNLEDEPSFSEEMEMVSSRLEDEPDTAPDIVICLQAVGHINSSNIAQLLRLRKIAESRKARVRICGVNTHVWSVLMTTGLDQVFKFTEDVMTAITSLQLEEQ